MLALAEGAAAIYSRSAFLLIRAFSLPKNYVLGQLGIFIGLSLFCYKSLYIRCKEAAAAQQILNIAISMYIIDTDGYL